MGAVRVTFGRTVGRARSLLSTAFAFAGFLAVTALLFVRGVNAGEGGVVPLPVIWALAVSPVLPILSALIAMDVWSDERQSGRLDSLLTVAVRERDYVLGKFFGCLALLSAAVLISLFSLLALMSALAPEALANVKPGTVVLSCAVLALQGLLWTSVAVAASAIFRHGATAACATVLALVVLPRGLWTGLQSWSSAGRTFFGEFPLDAHVVDVATGTIPLGTVSLYLVLTGVFVFLASRFVMSVRLVGRGARGLRWSMGISVFLALAFSVLSFHLFVRVNPVLDVPVVGERFSPSPRTRSILAETAGTLTVTSFVSRNNPASRTIAHLLRVLQKTSQSVGGARIELRYVDPRWDIGPAERLVRRGVSEDSVVFEKGSRIVSVPISTGVGERLCAATIRRISAPLRRRKVYWTVGHGENRFDDYGTFGMSDIARDLFREGFSHATIDLTTAEHVPSDCALIVVAGARDDFSRAETGRLNAYLHEGGRLLLLIRSSKSGGVTPLLPSWGIRPFDKALENQRTLSGTDVIVTDFSDHPISEPLRGSRILMDRPVFFAPSSVAASGAGVDRIDYSVVAEIGSDAVVSAVEQGAGIGADLALRPTRIVAIGDSGFVVNGQLSSRANANRDFFLNCVSYLSGVEAHGSGDEDPDTFASGLDRAGSLHMVLLAAVAVPSVVFLVLLAVVVRRRNRS